VSSHTINGILRVDPRARRVAWNRAILRLVATKPGAAVHRMIAAPLDAPIIRGHRRAREPCNRRLPTGRLEVDRRA
jgi:hypothetical protein